MKLGDIVVDVVLKNIKNVHLSVHPPTGRVRISAPARMNLETIRVFAISKLGWIKKQQKKLSSQERESPREYLERESHFVFGRRCTLKVIEQTGSPLVELAHNRLILKVRPNTAQKDKEKIVDEWYRQRLKEATMPLLAKWEPLIGVRVQRFFVQKMKTKWGSCNHVSRTIRINTDLAKKPPECLEYIVVHELVHLIERKHNNRFLSLMDRFMPKWRFHREALNRLPLRNEHWQY